MTSNPSRPRRRRYPLSGLLGMAATLLLLAPSASAAPAAGAKLVGKWAAVAMAVGGKRYPVKAPLRITFEYQAGGALVVVMATRTRTQTKRGTWRASATKVQMTVDKETQAMDYVIKGSQLTLRGKRAGHATAYFMKRVQ